jgi:hypothetical protein
MAKQLRIVWSVESRNDGRWAVRREGSKRADSLHASKDAAVQRSVYSASGRAGRTSADLGRRCGA